MADIYAVLLPFFFRHHHTAVCGFHKDTVVSVSSKVARREDTLFIGYPYLGRTVVTSLGAGKFHALSKW